MSLHRGVSQESGHHGSFSLLRHWLYSGLRDVLSTGKEQEVRENGIDTQTILNLSKSPFMISVVVTNSLLLVYTYYTDYWPYLFSR